MIFNQQFVTLIRAGLPILKGLDLLAERLTDPKLGPYIKAVRDDVRNGTLLSEAFRSQGIFPKMYVTSVMAGEKRGSLVEVLDRYISYQRIALAVRKKVMVSLMYPCVLIVLVVLLMVFLVTYVVPTFATLYSTMQANLPAMTVWLIAIGYGGAQVHRVLRGGAGRRRFSCSAGGRAAMRRADDDRPGQDADPDRGRDLDQVPGGAVVAHSGDAADGRHPAGAGDGDGGRFVEHAAAEAGGGEQRARACGKGSRSRRR